MKMLSVKCSSILQNTPRNNLFFLSICSNFTEQARLQIKVVIILQIGPYETPTQRDTRIRRGDTSALLPIVSIDLYGRNVTGEPLFDVERIFWSDTNTWLEGRELGANPRQYVIDHWAELRQWADQQEVWEEMDGDIVPFLSLPAVFFANDFVAGILRQRGMPEHPINARDWLYLAISYYAER